MEQGEVDAVIGPNGAGKTTLVAQLAGEVSPDSGPDPVRGRRRHRPAGPRAGALGLARSFQITSIFRDFSALDNVALAVQADAGHSFRLWRDARREATLRDPARAALVEVGLAGRAGVPRLTWPTASSDSSRSPWRSPPGPGSSCWTSPSPGWARKSRGRMVALLARLKRRQTLVLIEHDMDAVFALADRITVLVYGRVIATGSPDEIRGEPRRPRGVSRGLERRSCSSLKRSRPPTARARCCSASA